jgi:hypothetical protein
MAAGQGFKTFATGDVLSAADVNGYLMQGVLVFADSAERDAEITSPEEGQFAYLKDTNVTTYYTGSAWANLDTTGMTNPMTTTGDTIYSSSGSTPARLGIGSTGQVLTVAAGVPSWATPSGGSGMTLLASGSLSGSTLTISSISQDYVNLQLFVNNVVCSLTNESVKIQVNGTGNNNFYCVSLNQLILATSAANQDLYLTSGNLTNAQSATFNIYDYTSAYAKQIFSEGFTVSAAVKLQQWGAISGTGAITSLTIFPSGGTFTGNYKLYGVK